VRGLKLHYFSLLFLLVAIPAISQAQDTSAGPAVTPAPAVQPNTSQSVPAAKKKTKKVWTNEDLGSVKGGVSVVGEQNVAAGSSNAKKSPPASGRKDLRQQQIDSYRRQIQELQGQIDAADKRISQLKNFKGENSTPSGGINPSQGYNMVPLEDQVKQLEERKKQCQAKIEDVENEARKNGFEPGDLR
jgi:hypothetical protein